MIISDSRERTESQVWTTTVMLSEYSYKLDWNKWSSIMPECFEHHILSSLGVAGKPTRRTRLQATRPKVQ